MDNERGHDKSLPSFLFRASRQPDGLVAIGVLLLLEAGFITWNVGHDWLVIMIVVAQTGCGLALVSTGLLRRGSVIRVLSFSQVQAIWSRCKDKVIIQKTWFPEEGHIRDGLAEVLPEARVKLILCHPKADILRIRCESTRTVLEQAVDWIYEGLEVVVKNAIDDKFEGVGLYDAWPACPVIWADERTFMGFYLWGFTSPNQPWLEVKRGSKLERTLIKQRKKLWEKSEQLDTLDKLRDWLKRNPRPPMKGPGP